MNHQRFLENEFTTFSLSHPVSPPDPNISVFSPLKKRKIEEITNDNDYINEDQVVLTTTTSNTNNSNINNNHYVNRNTFSSTSSLVQLNYTSGSDNIVRSSSTNTQPLKVPLLKPIPNILPLSAFYSMRSSSPSPSPTSSFPSSSPFFPLLSASSSLSSSSSSRSYPQPNSVIPSNPIQNKGTAVERIPQYIVLTTKDNQNFEILTFPEKK